ncbi:MAG: AAA family ATPase [Thermoanaerobaculia bacterium]
MTDIGERRLHGIAVYNPDLLSKQELVAQFVARRELFAELVADLRRPKFMQHQLIVGHRGMGKTTLLRRLRYAVEDDPKLSSRWIALAFPEEQYNVSRLSDLYLNCIDALGDALERTGRRSEADALDMARENLPDDDESRRAAAALDLLLGTSRRLKRRLLLLVDNLDLILERLHAEQWTIRELLSREDRLLLIGATPFVIGATYEYDAPFYDFFRVHELGGLSFEETSALLATLAREMRAPDVERLVRDEPPRIRTLHVLAAGNPRTIVLLFSVLAQGTDGDVRSDLEKLLDQSTPLYKARFEALPSQAQQVIDALAIHWHPISAAELAEKLRFDVNIISSQLNRLAQQGVVEKVRYEPSSKTGFQIAERFFNIWYLMRASRRVRRRLTWLVQFLRLFYGIDQLQLRARDLLRSSEVMPLREAELCLAIADALDQDRPTQLALENRAIRAILATEESRREIQILFDLDGADAKLKPVVDRQTWARQYEDAICAASDTESAVFFRLLGASPDITPAHKLFFAQGFAMVTEETRAALMDLVISERTSLKRLLGPRLLHDLDRAVLDGYVVNMDDAEGFLIACAALNKPALELLPRKRQLSQERLLQIAHAADEPLAWAQYAVALAENGALAEASEVLQHVSWDAAGMFAQITRASAETLLGRHDTTASILRDLATGAVSPPEFRLLAEAYESSGERSLAYDTLQQGLSRHPEEPSLLRLYGSLLSADGRHAEARLEFEKWVAVDPLDESACAHLAFTMMRQTKFAEALEVVERRLEGQGSTFLSAMRVPLLLALRRRTDALRAAGDLTFDESVPWASEAVFRIVELFVVFSASWEETAPLLRATLPRAVLHLNDPEVASAAVAFFAVSAQRGFASRAAALLDELDLDEPLRPIYEALRIHAAGNRDLLNRLAPELRDPVVQLLDAWREPGAATPERKRKRKASTARKGRRRTR